MRVRVFIAEAIVADPAKDNDDTATASASGVHNARPIAPNASEEGQQPNSLLPKLLDFLKLAGAAYAIGFAVIMVHTARLGGPVVEAFEFQNIVAGLPVWVLLLIALYLWPHLVQPFMHRSDQAPINRKLLLQVIIRLALYVTAIYFSGQAIVQLLGQPSAGEKTILFFVVCFSASLLMLWSWYRTQTNTALLNVSVLLTSYSGLLLVVVCYAILLYPRVPQSIGGGHPVKVRLLLKDRGLAAVIGRSDQSTLSNPVDLYYRTSSFLLVSKGMGQSLIQVPMGDVSAVVYVDSSAK